MCAPAAMQIKRENARLNDPLGASDFAGGFAKGLVKGRCQPLFDDGSPAPRHGKALLPFACSAAGFVF